MVGSFFHSLWNNRELLVVLATKEIRARYRQATLGAFWTLGRPIALTVIFSLVFGRFLDVDSSGVPYSLFALCGVNAWQLFANGVTHATLSVMGNRSFVLSATFPRAAFPIATVGVAVTDFLPTFVVFLAYATWLGYPPTLLSLWFPVILVVQILFILAVGLFFSAMEVFFRDVGHGLPLLLQVWMYASPVIYSSMEVPERWRELYWLNPMAAIITSYRSILLHKRQPPWGSLGVGAVVSVLLLIVSVIIFEKLARRFPEFI